MAFWPQWTWEFPAGVMRLLGDDLAFDIAGGVSGYGIKKDSIITHRES